MGLDTPAAAAQDCDVASNHGCGGGVLHLHKAYGDVLAVDDVSFTVAEGEIFGVLGPNGAGKTTTVECVVGLRTPDGGSVTVLGLDPRGPRRAPRAVGVQLQESALPGRLKVGSARLYPSFYPAPGRRRRPGDALGLTDKLAPFGKLSGGQKQRLFIALALIGSPRVAVLDELTTGLDPQARRDTWDLVEGVRRRGVTVVLVTHFMDEAERLCDRLAVIDHGRVVAPGTPAALAADAGGAKVVRFAPSGPIGDHVLTDLPEVETVKADNGEVVVTGRGELVNAVDSPSPRTT